MKCVGAEQGPPCKRCIAGNHECIFEESNRGKRTSKCASLSQIIQSSDRSGLVPENTSFLRGLSEKWSVPLIPFSNLLGTLAWEWDRECFRGRLHRKLLVTLPKPFSLRLISIHPPQRLLLLPSRLPPRGLKQRLLQAPQNSIHYQTIASTHLVCLQRRALPIAVPTLQAPPEKRRQWPDPLRQWVSQAMHISNLVSIAVYFLDSPFWMIF